MGLHRVWQAALILATATYNWHSHLYRKRGGKGIIRAPRFHTALLKLDAQDWANLEACRIKAMLSYLARLSGRTSNSRPGFQLTMWCVHA